MKDMVKVLVLRRQLSLEETSVLQAAFPGKRLSVVIIQPADHTEHAALCREHKADLVILPKERPIPSTAMEDGFPHVAIMPDGGLMELLPLAPTFRPFKSNLKDK